MNRVAALRAPRPLSSFGADCCILASSSIVAFRSVGVVHDGFVGCAGGRRTRPGADYVRRVLAGGLPVALRQPSDPERRRWFQIRLLRVPAFGGQARVAVCDSAGQQVLGQQIPGPVGWQPHVVQ